MLSTGQVARKLGVSTQGVINIKGSPRLISMITYLSCVQGIVEVSRSVVVYRVPYLWRVVCPWRKRYQQMKLGKAKV